MEITVIERRLLVILKLQERRNKHTPRSYLFEIYDKAIDLALNPKRQINEFLIRNLIRDAKRILNRQIRSRPKFIAIEENQESSEKQFINIVTPLDDLLFQYYKDAIRADCPRVHIHAWQILEDTISAVTVKETAATLGISESLVKKIRVEIKDRIFEIIKN